MALLDHITEAVNRFLPQKREKIPQPLNTATGGIGHGFSNHKEDMIISKPQIVFHALQIFFTFLAMCCFAAVAGFQGKWNVGPSGLSDFVLFVTVLNILLSVFLVTIPVLYDKYDKAIRLARALREDRVQFILTGVGIATIPLVALITIISAFTQAGCKNPKNDPHAKELGDDFTNGLPGWCRTKKAGSIFLWLAAAAYIAAFGYVFYNWRRGRSVYGGNLNAARDPPFTHPEEPSQDFDEEEGDPYSRSAHPRVSDQPPRIGDDLSSPFGDENRYSGYSAPGRQSMDPYGAFNDDAPTGYGGAPTRPNVVPPPAIPGPASPGISRTMQYADPYAAVRGRLAQASPAPQPQPPTYEYPGGFR
ncbi:hypothetical protein EXIGLDRAFT_730894 [Exidia glandulosa HHB12029]|uniref:MARVEL domain-containing protein n=1 Tax=Exidia glandulosa HHB12029 TaxID=1314781 RepID=A0A165PX08_EXIGL|nr:hypothetical protein EXIGLDRAFT_730894 [Exidia glandulosa HHB12029]